MSLFTGAFARGPAWGRRHADLWSWLLAATVFGLMASSSSAQEPSVSAELQAPIADNAVRASLDRAEQFLRQGHHQDAIDLMVRLIESSGDQLAPRFDGVGWIPLRSSCQILLCELAVEAPEGLRLYRRQADPLAAQWLEQARSAADPAPLRRIVGQLLASSWGDDALMLLGDHCLQRGDVPAARHYWQMISPQLTTPATARPAWLRAAAGAPLWETVEELDSEDKWRQLAGAVRSERGAGRLVVRDSELPLAAIRARLVLASITAGERPRAAAELAILERLHPGAAGRLAGAEGPLAPRLRTLLDESRRWRRAPPDRDWAMLGKRSDRNGRAPAAFQLGAALWSCELEQLPSPWERLFPDQRRPAEPDGPLPYHIAASGGRVAVVEPQRVRILNLRTGAPSFGAGDGEIWRAADWQSALSVNPEAPHAGVARFGGALFDDRLLVRTGPAITSSSEPDDVKNSQLLALDLTREGRVISGFPIDCRPAEPGDEGAGWCFEHAPPLWRGDSVYALTRWNDGVRAVLHLDCYAVGSGRRRWRTRLGGGRTWAQQAQAPRDPPWKELTSFRVTRSHDSLFVCTHVGLVCGVDAVSGNLLWATPYPRCADPEGSGHGHAARAAPPLVAGELVIVTPQDAGAVLAFNRFDGRLVWQTPAELTGDVVHLLGADSRRLVAAGDRLVWIDLRTGQVQCRFPEGGAGPGARARLRAAVHPAACGRGLIAGELILWPTRDAIYRFRVAPAPPAVAGRWMPVGVGTPFDLRLRGLTGGNLSWSDDVLLIAGRDRLTAVATYGSADQELGQMTKSKP